MLCTLPVLSRENLAVQVFLCVFHLYYIILFWITDMTYSKHELSTISMFYSRKKKKKIVILQSASFSQQPPFYKGPKVAVVERFGCILKSSILLQFIHFQLCIPN